MQHEGELESMNKGPSGVKKDNTPWQIYKYEVGGKVFSSFKSPVELEIKMGDYLIVAYNEAPNKDYPDKPHKNIINITQGTKPTEGESRKDLIEEAEALIGKDEMKEEYKKVKLDMTEVTKPNQPKAIPTEEDRWEKINAVKEKKILVGQVTNLTVKWIMNERRIEQTNKPSLDDNFSDMFNLIWTLANEKRKEKLEVKE